MTQPIQPTTPVSPIITIQPVTTTVPNRESAGAPNPLANLASGTTVEGFVVNRDAQNNPILRTAIGDLRVTSEVFLKTGSEVVFRVDTSQASLARIMTVDGLTPQDYNAQHARGLTKDTIAAPTLQLGNTTHAAIAGKAATSGVPILQALIVQGQPLAPSLLNESLKTSQTGALPLLTQLTQLRAGTPLRLSVLDLKLPPLPVSVGTLPNNNKLDALLPPPPQQSASTAPAPSSANTTVPAQATVGGQPSAVDAATTPRLPIADNLAAEMDETAALTASLGARQQISATRLSSDKSAEHLLLQSEMVANYGKVTPAHSHYSPTRAGAPLSPSQAAPAQQQTASTPPRTDSQFTANVIGHEADGANILHTPFATLKLYTTQPLPTGTALLVDVAIDKTSPLPASQPLSGEEQRLTGTPRDWQSLDDAINWLKQANTDVAREVTQRLPTVDHKLSSGLLFFVAALKAGDVNELLGKRATRLLETSAPNLLSKLRQDLSQMQSSFLESPLAHWSVAQLPMLFGQEMQQVRLYVSKDPEGDSTSGHKEGRGHRFILEVGMSQLGAMQLDGFVRTLENRKNFDLVVRSSSPLDSEISKGISSIFHASMEIVGMHGHITFQQGTQHFIKPATETKPGFGSPNLNTILA